MKYSQMNLLHFPFAKCDITNLFTLPELVSGQKQISFEINNPCTLI